MIIRFIKFPLLYFLSLTVVFAGNAQEHRTPINNEEARSQARLAGLLKAAESSRPRLEAAVKSTAPGMVSTSVFPKSRVAQMIYAAHVYQVSTRHLRDGVLNALPRTATEMEAFYEFTHEKGAEQFRPYYAAFYEAAFQSVAREPKSLPNMFDVATQFDTKIWPNYDDVDFFCSKLGELRKKIPEQYDRAIRSRSIGDRKFLADCGR